MPRQNRVNPFGEIVAIEERGTFMGNRGNLHDHGDRILRKSNGKRWIICMLQFKGRKRQLMTPGEYTELFFWDEAIALAAGHRPCAECRRDRFKNFCKAWQESRGDAKPPSADEIDSQLRAERTNADRSQRTFVANLKDLPNGVFVHHDSWGADPFLVWNHHLLRWIPEKYSDPVARSDDLEVKVLTPESTVKTIKAGYVPEVHFSICGAD